MEGCVCSQQCLIPTPTQTRNIVTPNINININVNININTFGKPKKYYTHEQKKEATKRFK